MITLLLSILVVSLLIILLFTPVYRKVNEKSGSPYYFDVENKTNDKLKAVLYGFNRYAIAVNFGSDVGIHITCPMMNVDYNRSINQSSVNPFIVKKTILVSKLKHLLDLVIVIESVDLNGQSCKIPIFVKNYITGEIINNNSQEDTIKIDVPYNFKINCNNNLLFELNPESKIDIRFYYETETYIKSNFFSVLLKKVEKTLKY